MTISEVSEKYEISQDTLRYYERIGAIPPVHRTKGGVRDYTEEDTGWIELVKCMRSAGLSVEALVQYVKLTQKGDTTLLERRELLNGQREQLIGQLEAIRRAKERLDYKISRYDEALKTGRLSWD
ncbi:MAG: MerR family transcriptional regulator [Lachnospiraceae bacterium]